MNKNQQILQLLDELATLDPDMFPNDHVLALEPGSWLITHPLHDRVEYGKLQYCPINTLLTDTDLGWYLHEVWGEGEYPVTHELLLDYLTEMTAEDLS